MINPGASFCNRDVMKFFHVFKVCTDNATNLLKVIKHKCSFSLRFKVVNLFLVVLLRLYLERLDLLLSAMELLSSLMHEELRLVWLRMFSAHFILKSDLYNSCHIKNLPYKQQRLWCCFSC